MLPYFITFRRRNSLGGEGIYEAKFYGLGADGTVGKQNSIKIIGDNSDKYSQTYFSTTVKSGGFTCSHLRFGDTPIRSTYLVTTPNFVACHVQAYLRLYDVTKGLKKNGTFLAEYSLECGWSKRKPSVHIKRYFAKNNVRLFIIDATHIAKKLVWVTEPTPFYNLHSSNTNVIPYDLPLQNEKAIVSSYGRKGEDIVNKTMQQLTVVVASM